MVTLALITDWRRPRLSALLGLAVALATATVVAADSATYARNRERLERMSPAERRQMWQRHEAFRALPAAEQQRIRRLHAGLRKLPAQQRGNYQRLMQSYRQWKERLPLYERQALDEAVSQGSARHYATLREVMQRQQQLDALRPYWLLPDNPRVRTFVENVLGKLSKDQIEVLDQMPPRDRYTELLAYAGQHGVDVPAVLRPDRAAGVRPWPPGPLPPIDRERIFEFLKTLPREKKAELDELAAGDRAARQRLLLRWYYEKHPQELDRRRKSAGPNGARPDQAPAAAPQESERPRKDRPGPAFPRSPERPDRRPPGKIGIPTD